MAMAGEARRVKLLESLRYTVWRERMRVVGTENGVLQGCDTVNWAPHGLPMGSLLQGASYGNSMVGGVCCPESFRLRRC